MERADGGSAAETRELGELKKIGDSGDLSRLAAGELEDTIILVEGTPLSRSTGNQARAIPTNLVWACGIGLIAFIVLAISGPGDGGPHFSAVRSATVQTALALGLALYSYANDNQGLYPDGTSSTEVFQKLMDGGYVTDPAVFYVAMDGKTNAASGQKLKPENVCWDVTGGASSRDLGRLPLLYLTGFRVTFTPNGGIAPLEPFPPYKHFSKDGGAIVYFTDNFATWISPNEQTVNFDGQRFSMEHLIAPDFKAYGKTYRQLTPDGVLR
jgi:hypothetical protein